MPCIVLKDNVGVNKKYINEKTGVLIKEKELKNTLLWFRAAFAYFNPRDWALKEISPEVTTQRLEMKLKEIARQMGEPWTKSIVIKANRPECEYFDKDTKLSPFEFKKYRRA